MNPAYYGETAESCTLDRCVDRVKEMIGWDEKYPRKDMGNGKVRGVGIAMAMQGSSISKVDVASVTIKVNDDGFYSMTIGASDMGTGCDTTLAQVAAECLNCEMDDIVVYGVDTDISPYDSGSYASSTAYLTGNAVVKTCETLKKKIIKKAAEYLSCGEDELEFTGKSVKRLTPVPEGSGFENEISLLDIGNRAMCFNNEALQATESCPVSISTSTSAAPAMNGGGDTGDVQTEGGLVQGIGMALYEDVTNLKNGHVCENSLMLYKLPTRLDIGRVQVELECSYEPTGPFGFLRGPLRKILPMGSRMLPEKRLLLLQRQPEPTFLSVRCLRDTIRFLEAMRKLFPQDSASSLPSPGSCSAILPS